MWRSLIAAAVVYSFGHPSFDGHRPTVMDKPLQSFYQEVNIVARDGHKVLSTLDDARSMRYLKTYITKMDAQLRSAD